MFPESEDWDNRLMVDDVARATQKAVELGLVNKDRIAVMGTSFGAYLSVAAATLHPGLYKCALGISGIYDWGKYIREDKYQQYTSAYYSRRLYKWGDPKTNADRYDAMSPLPHAAQLHSALFIAWGEFDDPEGISQSKDMASAAEHNGVPVETISFLNEANGVRHLAHSVELYQHIEAFLAKNL